MFEPCMSADIPPLANRRPATRKRTFLGCTVVFGEGTHSFACVIRNVTPAGARIGFEAGHSMPSSFWLINNRDRTAHKAHIAWATAKEAGLEFESSIPLHQLPAELTYLKHYAGRVR